MVGLLNAKPSEISPAVMGLTRRRSKIFRRVGSFNALNNLSMTFI